MNTRTLKILILIASGLGLSACGTSASGPRLYKVSTEYGHVYSGTSGGTSSATCTTRNVTPARDINFDGRDVYSACGDATNASKVRIVGETSSPNPSVCVFPAEQRPDGLVLPKKDALGSPIVLCGLVDANSGSTFEFISTRFNGVFVAPLLDKARMISCLSANSPSSCPNYSYGSFR